MPILDLWTRELYPDVNTPAAILKAQAEHLETRLRGRVRASVIKNADETSRDAIVLTVMADRDGATLYKLLEVLSPLGRPYPAQVRIWAQHSYAAPLEHGAEESFTQALREALANPKVLGYINSALADALPTS